MAALVLGAEEVFRRMRERWGGRSFQGLVLQADGNWGIQAGGARCSLRRCLPCVLAFFCSVVAAQLCQSFVFLDFVSILLLSFWHLLLLSLSLLFRFSWPPVCSLRNFLMLWLFVLWGWFFFLPLWFLPWPRFHEWLSTFCLGPLIHSMTLKLATPLLLNHRSTLGSQPSAAL